MQEAFQREREGFQREREGFQRERTALENAAAEARARAETEGTALAKAERALQDMMRDSVVRNALLRVRDHESLRKRCLTDPPIEITGDVLPKIISQVECTVNENRGSSNLSKDERGLIIVRAPPRHGKSLLLDRIFLNAVNICVVKTTFNSTTHFTRDHRDLNDKDLCIWHFVARVYLAVYTAGKEANVSGLIPALKGQFKTPEDAFWSMHVKLHAASIKCVVYALDELSNMTSITTDDQNARFSEFITACNIPQGADQPPWFVATMFTHTSLSLSTGAAGLSGSIRATFHFDCVDPDQTRGLIAAILACYRTHRPSQAEFPTMLWEVCKSSPGLLGELARRVYLALCNRRTPPGSFYEFAELLPWAQRLGQTSSEAWSLLEQYFRGMMLEAPMVDENVRLQLIDCQLALESTGSDGAQGSSVQSGVPVVHPVPFAVAVVVTNKVKSVKKLKEVPVEDVPVDVPLTYLERCIAASANHKTVITDKRSTTLDGGPAEIFALNALHLRALYFSSPVPVSATAWFRSGWHRHSNDVPPSYVKLQGDTNGSVLHLAFQFGRVSLMHLITPVLYNLFPVGCEEAADFVARHVKPADLDIAVDGQQADLKLAEICRNSFPQYDKEFLRELRSDYGMRDTDTDQLYDSKFQKAVTDKKPVGVFGDQWARFMEQRSQVGTVCKSVEVPDGYHVVQVKADEPDFRIHPAGANAVKVDDDVIRVNSFPVDVSAKDLDTISERLHGTPNRTFFVEPTATNAACEFTLATYWAATDDIPTPSIELIYVEIKDRRELNGKDVTHKLRPLTSARKAPLKFSEEVFGGDVCVRELLVIAGRCDHMFDFRVGGGDEMKRMPPDAARHQR